MLKHIQKSVAVLMFALILGCGFSTMAQQSLTLSPYVQNFDAVGSGLPTGWGLRVNTTPAAAGIATSLTTGQTAWSLTTAGCYNAAAIKTSAPLNVITASSTDQNAATDRVIKTNPTGAFGDPGLAVQFTAANTAGYTNFALNFDLMVFNNAGRTSRMILEYGVGSSPSTFIRIDSFLINPNSFGIIPKSYNSTALAGLENQTGNVTIRLRHGTSGGGGTRSSWGIDNFNLSWTSTPTKLSITSVSPPNPQFFSNFNVAVAALNSANNPAPVTSNTLVTISSSGGAGVLSGTLTGDILSGSNTATIGVMQYSDPESITLTASATGLSSGTTSLTVVPPPSAEPTTQATINADTLVAFSATGFNNLTLNFGAGNGSHRIVVAKAASAVDADPVDATFYSANASFGSGDDLGAGNYVVYFGTGTSVNVTGLQQGVQYHFKVYELNKTVNGTENYLLTDAPSTSKRTNAQVLTAGDLAIVAYNPFSQDGICVLPLVDLAEGTQFKFTDQSWTGTALGVGENTPWTFTVGEGGISKGTVIKFQGSAPPSGGTLSGPAISGLSDAGDNVFLFTGENAAPNFIYSLSINAYITSGIPNTQNTYLPSTLTLGVSAIELPTYTSGNTKFNLDNFCGTKSTVLSYIGTTSNWIFDPSNPSPDFSTYNFNIGVSDAFAAEPTATASGINFTSVTPFATTVNWTNAGGSGTGKLVVIRDASAVSFVPEDGFTYSVSNTYSSSTAYNTNNYVVYDGSGTSVSISSLLPSTTFYYAIYSYSESGGCRNYFATPEMGFQATQAGPAIYYSTASGDLNDLANWGDNTDGTLSEPGFALTSFNASNRTYQINSGLTAATLSAPITINGNNSKLVVPSGVTLTIPSSAAITFTGGAKLDVNDGGTAVLEAATLPAFGTLGTSSTVVFNQSAEVAVPTKVTDGAIFGNLTLKGSGRKLFKTNIAADSTIVRGNLLFEGPLTFNTSTSGGNSTRIKLLGNLDITGTVTPTAGFSAISGTVVTDIGYPNYFLLGGNNQTITGTFSTGFVEIFALTINKTAGAVTLGANTDLKMQSSATLTINGSASFTDGGNNILVGANFETNGLKAGYNLTGAVVLSGTTGTQNIRSNSPVTNSVGVADLNNVTINNTGTAITDFNGYGALGAGTVVIKGNLTVNAGSTGEVRFRSNTYELSGNYTNNSTSTRMNHLAASTFKFVSDADATFSPASDGLERFGNLDFAKTDEKSVIMLKNARVRGNFTLRAEGYFDTDSAMTFDGTNQTLNVFTTASFGELIVKSNLTYTAGDGPAFLGVKRELKVDSVFNASSGTTVYVLGADVTSDGSAVINLFNFDKYDNTYTTNINAPVNVYGKLSIEAATRINTNNNLTIASNASYTGRIYQGGASEIIGNVTVERYIDRSKSVFNGGYFFVAHPFKTGIPYTEYTKNENIIVGVPGSANPNSSSSSLWLYTNDSTWYKPASINSTLDTAQGSYMFFRNTFFGTNPTISVSGQVNNALNGYSIPVKYNTTTLNGWNLVGNPMPSELDWESTEWTKTNLNDVIYVWDHVAQTYRGWQNGVGAINGGSSIINTSEAFFVEANAASASLVVNSEDAKYDPNRVEEQRKAAPLKSIKLELAGNGYKDEALVVLNPKANNGLDKGLDAGKIDGHQLTIATKVGNKKLGYNHIPTPSSTTIVPVNVAVKNAGNYAISFNNLNNLPSNVDAFLQDNYTGLIQPIYQGSVYSFNVNADLNSQGDRFALVFAKQGSASIADAVVSPSLNLFPNPATGGVVKVQVANFAKNVSLRVIDMTGKTISEQVTENGTVSLTGLKAGVYQVVATDGALIKTSKLVVE